MHTYEAYGLKICSSIALPELVVTASKEADVVIQMGEVKRPSQERNSMGVYFHITPEEAYLTWEKIGKFLVRGGKEIIIEPFPDAEESLVRLPLLGAVLAVLLHQRGFLVIHASAVAINGSVVAFLGDKGQGKSTMAAYFYSCGHHLMADDVVALELSRSNSYLVVPSFPQFKLWPDAVTSLGDDPEKLARLVAGYEKRVRRISERFSQRPIKLKRIYVLSEGKTPEIKPLQPQEAILQLISNSYVARFGNQLLQGEGGSLHFLQCTNLAKSVPISLLERPRSLSLLAEVAQLVEKDLAYDTSLIT